MLPITKQISAYNHSAPNNIQYIVIHDTGCATTDTASANANYFCGGDRQASAHYFVDPSSIYQVVEESMGAWHCGDGGGKFGIGNHNSIGIEMCINNNVIADATINNTVDLVKSLMARYGLGVDKVVRHFDASRKNCPSHMSANNWAKWNEFKSRLSGQSVSQPTPNNNQGSDYEMKIYQNGSTPEIVYQTSACTEDKKIGCLNPGETATCIGEIDGRAIVLYKIDGTNSHKVGFCRWLGGIQG